MSSETSLTHRLAQPSDGVALMSLYQNSSVPMNHDSLFLDVKKLQRALSSSQSLWMLTECNGKVSALISVLVDTQQGLAKISRMMVASDSEDSILIMRESLRHVLNYLRTYLTEIDVVYTTTLTMPFPVQEITLWEGFKIMGVFPNALGADNSKLNGLTVYYMKDVLESKRYESFSLHPVVAPFFRICGRQTGLKEPPQAGKQVLPQGADYEPLPPLEVVQAPLLVQRKFQKLMEHRSQLINFYPFYKPNTLICDPDQEVEIYVKISPSIRFAAIIGEHLERTVHPVALYSAVLQLLRQQNVSYVEIINDAADVYGTQYILEATFTPCAYIPAFKRQGESRRDYVIFGKSFEYLCHPDLNIEKPYIEFFKQYFKLERRNYFRGRFPVVSEA